MQESTVQEFATQESTMQEFTDPATSTRETMYSRNPNPKLHSSVMPTPVQTPSSQQGDDEQVPAFGSRFLTADKDVWSKNAWDHVPPPEGHESVIVKALERQRLAPVSDENKEKYNARPANYWNQFYRWNENNFFKDRKWLHNEFPELVQASSRDAPATRIVEVGCGTGATSFPLLSINENPRLDLIATDYSSKAIEVVKSNALFASPPVGTIKASVWDLTSADGGLPEGVQEASVDIVVMIFVLSALHPKEWGNAVANVYKMLKPGGRLLIRDYGRHDLAQLRFKEDRLLEEHLYVRGDGTRVYFFTLDEVATLFTGQAHIPPSAALPATNVEESVEEDTDSRLHSPSPEDATSSGISTPTLPTQPLKPGSAESHDPDVHRWIPKDAQYPGCPLHPLFRIEQLGVDRRLIVNRKRQLKMYRVWIQGKFVKIA